MSDLNTLRIDIFWLFFDQPKVKKMLKYFHENEMMGWEKWLQFELLSYLDSSSKVKRKSVKKEVPLNSDGRKPGSRSSMRVDIEFRLANKQGSQKILLELKCSRIVASLHRNILSDIKKIKTLLPTDKLNLRSVWVLGICRNQPTLGNSDESDFQERFDKKININDELIDCGPIAKTGFRYFLAQAK